MRHSLLFPLGSLLLVASVEASSGGLGNRRVLVIGIDGARPDAVQAASTPNLDALIATGAVTWNAVSGGPPDPSDPAHQDTSSGPGWSSLLIGVWADSHDVYDNGDYSSGDFVTYPHFFRRVRDAYPAARLSSIVQWHPINQNMLHPFPGLATFTQEVSNSGQAVENAALAHLGGDDPDVLFLHFDDVDHAGHASGFNAANSAYLQAIENTDTHIGNVIAAIQARPSFPGEDWMVLVTTDHGGTGTVHGGHTPGERRIWIVANGGGVANHEFADGPGHTAVARTALHHLGVTVSPAWGLVDAEPFGFADVIASVPTPADGTELVALDAQLSWLAGEDALSQDVYFGTNPNPGPAELQGNQAASSFDPGALAESTVYYWRVDTITAQGTEVGDVWSFETVGTLLDDLVVRLDLDGDALDSSGRANHATAVGNPTYVAGAFGQGVLLDGSGDHLRLGAPADLAFGASTDFSVAFWIRSTGWSSDPSFLSNKDWVSGSNTGWIIAGESDGTSWQWNYRGASAPRLDFDLIAPVADGSWHHLAVTHDRDGDAVFYQDGVVMGSISLVGTGDVDSGLPTAIGQDGTLAYGVDLSASLDEVGIWRRVLGAAEIQRLVNLGFPTDPGVGFCFGDTGCPCGNDDPGGGGGCATSTGSGAVLTGSGSTSVSSDDLVLTVANLPSPNANGIFFHGPASLPPFVPASADGAACTGGGFRYGGILDDNVPPDTMTMTGLVGASNAGGVPIVAGQAVHFQAWFRDNNGSPCGGSSNLSNGLKVTFTP